MVKPLTDLGKKCVQQVRNTRYNHGEIYPHTFNVMGINSHQPHFSPILTHRITTLNRLVSQPPYTGLFNIPTERKRLLSTVSTPPITTTTTYI